MSQNGTEYSNEEIEDVEGHIRVVSADAPDEDDVEGHLMFSVNPTNDGELRS